MKKLRFFLLTIAAMSAFVIYLIVSTTNPSTIPSGVKALFYFAVITCIMSAWSSIRLSFVTHEEKKMHSVGFALPIIRQGAIIGVTLTLFLMLRALRILSIWDVLLIIVAAILFELFFRVRIPIARVE